MGPLSFIFIIYKDTWEQKIQQLLWRLGKDYNITKSESEKGTVCLDISIASRNFDYSSFLFDIRRLMQCFSGIVCGMPEEDFAILISHSGIINSVGKLSFSTEEFQTPTLPNIRTLESLLSGEIVKITANPYPSGVRPKIVTLCGSSKHKAVFDDVEHQLTLEGNITISTGRVFGHCGDIDMSGPIKKRLDKLHFWKIVASDAIYVVNPVEPGYPNGRIGVSTCDEIFKALSLGKEVYFLVDPKCDSFVLDED